MNMSIYIDGLWVTVAQEAISGVEPRGEQLEFIAFILLGSVGVAVINGYILPLLITGTSTADVIMRAILPIGWGVAIIVAILMKIHGSGREEQNG